MLLSTNLARERLQIDKTANDLSGIPTSMTLNDLETEK